MSNKEKLVLGLAITAGIGGFVYSKMGSAWGFSNDGMRDHEEIDDGTQEGSYPESKLKNVDEPMPITANEVKNSDEDENVVMQFQKALGEAVDKTEELADKAKEKVEANVDEVVDKTKKSTNMINDKVEGMADEVVDKTKAMIEKSKENVEEFFQQESKDEKNKDSSND